MSNSNMDISETTKVLKKLNFFQSSKETNTFDFPSLPYVCQRRFAEICDAKTLKTFALINLLTRNLSKRCHIIKEVFMKYLESISNYSCKITVSFFCKENEFCKGVTLLGIRKKFDVLNEIKIENPNGKIDSIHLQSLPFNFNAVNSIDIEVKSMKLEDIRKLISSPNLKTLDFCGGVEFDGSFKKFIEFIKSLKKFKRVTFSIDRQNSALLFGFEDLIEEGKKLWDRFDIHGLHSSNFFVSFFI